jgi:hypothetical protein
MTAFLPLLNQTFQRTVIRLPRNQQQPKNNTVEGILKVKPTNRLIDLIEVVETELITCSFRCVNPAVGIDIQPGDSVLIVNTQSSTFRAGDSLKVVEVNESNVNIVNPIVGITLTLIKNVKRYHTN